MENSCGVGMVVDCFHLGTPFQLYVDPRLKIGELISACAGHSCGEIVGHGLFPLRDRRQTSGATMTGLESVIADILPASDVRLVEIAQRVSRIDASNPWQLATIGELLALGAKGSSFLYAKQPIVALGSVETSRGLDRAVFPALTVEEDETPHIGTEWFDGGKSAASMRFLLCRPVFS